MSQSFQTQKCHALVISGGSDWGGFSAGALQVLEQNNLTNYDIISGIGTGAITAAILAGKQNNQNISQTITELWQYLRLDHVSETFQGGLDYGQLYDSGLLSYEPLKSYLKSQITSPRNTGISIGYTNIDTGKFERFTDKNNYEQLAEAVMASVSMAFYFPWSNIENKNLFQAEITKILDLEGVLSQCMQKVENENDISVDIISLVSKNSWKKWPNIPNQKTYQAYRRDLMINSVSRMNNEIQNFFQSHPSITSRYFIQPSEELQDEVLQLYYFSQEGVEKQIEHGKNKTQEAIQQSNSGVVTQQMFQSQSLIQKFRQLYPQYTHISDQELLDLIQQQ